MPLSEWRFRIVHMLTAITKIQRYTLGMTAAEFEANAMAVDAVLYNFIVLGEAARAIPENDRPHYPEIPWRQVLSMRNFLTHQYPSVRLATVWDTLRDDLPTLERTLGELLESEP